MKSPDAVLSLPAPLRWSYMERLRADLKDEKDQVERAGR